MSEVSRVYTCVELEGINVRKQGIEEIIAEPPALSFIEAKAIDQVLLGFVKNLDLHFLVSSRILLLALFQSP